MDKAQFTIGRAKDNDLVLVENDVSITPASRRCAEGRCGSANGTYINGERITSRELKDQDVIRFANLQFRWRRNLYESAPPNLCLSASGKACGVSGTGYRHIMYALKRIVRHHARIFRCLSAGGLSRGMHAGMAAACAYSAFDISL